MPEFDERPIVDLLRSSFERLGGNDGQNNSMAILIASSDEISRLHAHHFGDPSDTDVMSFPSGDDDDGVERYLGDIAISRSVAGAQAAEHGHSLQQEIAYLALHGLLHLLGHDDMDSESRRKMLALQDSLFDDFEHDWSGIT